MITSAPDQAISSLDDLVGYFRAAAKPATRFRVGVEHEKLPVRDNGMPACYDGPEGIAALLGRMQRLGFLPQREDGHTIALERGEERITLEPGGQLELSGPALPSASAGADVLLRHVRELGDEARALGIRLVAGGFRPFGRIDDVPWLPKRRYAVMREYLPGKGRLAHEMMKRTATVQANFDFADEADAVEKIRTGLGVSSIVTAMFAASPITEGRPNGYKSYRAAVWLEMDEDRCGILPFAFAPDFVPGLAFTRYVGWALDVPMFFVVRQGIYHPAGGLTFRRFIAEGWRSERATLHDWEVHLSTLFPEVRLKRTIEMRGADAGPLPFVQGLAALWRGLLEDQQARAAAWSLVGGWTLQERERLRREVPRAGLATRVAGRSVGELAVELGRLAHAGLGRLAAGAGDQRLLEPIVDYAARGRCAADDMLDEWQRVRGEPRRLVDAWELKAD